MIDKIRHDLADALGEVRDGASVLISGFGGSGSPIDLSHVLIDQGARDLTIISNNAGKGGVGIAALIAAKRVRKMVCSFPRSTPDAPFAALYRLGEIELELVPQGTLAERIRAGGAGVAAFYTPTGAGTSLAEGKETRWFGGREYVLETAIRADLALIKAEAADRWGNLVYNKAGRNFGPIMCTAADRVVVQVRRIEPLGSLDPETIITPSIFVDAVVQVANPISEDGPGEEARRA